MCPWRLPRPGRGLAMRVGTGWLWLISCHQLHPEETKLRTGIPGKLLQAGAVVSNSLGFSMPDLSPSRRDIVLACPCSPP